MKKIILLLLLFLCGCTPQPTMRNTACSKVSTIRVIRVADDVILGWTNIEGDEALYSHRTFYRPTDAHYVYLKRDPQQVYYPGQIFRLSDKACLKYTGSFSYHRGGVEETTLKGEIDTSENPNPEYMTLMAEKYEKAKTSCWIRRRLGQKCNKK